MRSAIASWRPGLPAPSSLALLAAALEVALSIPAGAHAQADEPASPRCRRVRATAESSAYLLVSPVLWVEGVHVPRIGDETGAGLVVGGEYQVRAALSWSPIDLARGVLLLEQASTECRQLEAARRARRVLELGDSIGELPARRAELGSLEASMPEVESLVARARAQLEAGVGTRSDLTALELEARRLARRRTHLDAEIARLVEAGHDDVDPSTLSADLAIYEASSRLLEDQRSSMRRLSPWTVSVRGGVVPSGDLDWFGQVQVGLNLGVFAHHAAENAAVEARRDELEEESTELRSAVRRLRERLRVTLPSLEEDVGHVESLIALSIRQRELLAELATSDVEHERALLDMSLVGLRAEHARLSTLLEVRSALGTDPDAHE